MGVGITILIVVVIMFIASSLVMLCMMHKAHKKYKNQVGGEKVDTEKREEYKEVLQRSPSASTCAKMSWGAICNDATVFTINKRKSKYSDERESEHFCENLTDDRVILMNKIDAECHYGRY